LQAATLKKGGATQVAKREVATQVATEKRPFRARDSWMVLRWIYRRKPVVTRRDGSFPDCRGWASKQASDCSGTVAYVDNALTDLAARCSPELCRTALGQNVAGRRSPVNAGEPGPRRPHLVCNIRAVTVVVTAKCWYPSVRYPLRYPRFSWLPRTRLPPWLPRKMGIWRADGGYRRSSTL